MDEMKRFSYAHHAAEQQQAEITEHRHELVKKLLAKLPERERTVVTLHYLGEMTVKEIGRCLVLCHWLSDGYNLLSLMRASCVVNRHLTVARC